MPAFVILALVPVLASGPAGSLPELVEVERAFAARVRAAGVAVAFEEVLDLDGVLFRPAPVDGRTWLREHPGGSAILDWTPDLVAVSASGDLGFTSGPWTQRREPTAPVEASGTYVSVWRRPTPGGPWRLVADGGVAHAPEPTRDVRVLQPEAGVPDLPEIERPSADGVPRCESLSSRSSRGLRDGQQPAIGAAAGCALAARSGSFGRAYRVRESGMSRTLDLAYVYGVVDPEVAQGGVPPGSGGFLHVWLFERGAWRRVVDLELLPSAAP